VLAPHVRGVMSIPESLLADLIGPLAEPFVLPARARQQGPERESRRQADETDDHRILRDVVLEATARAPEPSHRPVAPVPHPATAVLIGVRCPARSTLVGVFRPLSRFLVNLACPLAQLI